MAGRARHQKKVSRKSIQKKRKSLIVLAFVRGAPKPKTASGSGPTQQSLALTGPFRLSIICTVPPRAFHSFPHGLLLSLTSNLETDMYTRHCATVPRNHPPPPSFLPSQTLPITTTFKVKIHAQHDTVEVTNSSLRYRNCASFYFLLSHIHFSLHPLGVDRVEPFTRSSPYRPSAARMDAHHRGEAYCQCPQEKNLQSC